MSSKILTSLTEENPNLQKQMGCMNGIFQLFDRHHFLTSRRLRSHKKLLPGPSSQNAAELTGAKPVTPDRKGQGKEMVNEKHRVSTESSRPSTSSSFSSDHITTHQQDPARHQSFSDTLPQIKQHSPTPPSNQPVDLRDVVKDSMHREARGLSIRVVAKEEGRSYVIKHIDSPRPLQQPKSGQAKIGKQPEAQRRYKEDKKLGPKDPPRFSYDGRELRDATRSRLKELPRLSLDNRDIRSPASEPKSNSLLTDVGRYEGRARQIQNLVQEPSSSTRSSSIVAKLMGLEVLPDCTPTTNQAKVTQDEYLTSRSSQTAEGRRQNQVWSPRVPQKDPGSTRPSKIGSATKPASSPKVPQEQAPWRQPGNSRGHLKQDARTGEDSADSPCASSTVYGEIEKRITDLEFKGSGKDLRALKQILNAMEKTRKRLENQNAELETRTNRFNTEVSHCYKDSKSLMLSQNQKNYQQHPEGTSPPRRRDSSIVIMKPVKLIERFRNSDSPPVSVADEPHVQMIRPRDARSQRVDLVDKRVPLDKNKTRVSKVVHISREPKHIRGEHYTSPAKSSGIVSPRSQQQKLDTDKRSNPATCSTDLQGSRSRMSKMHADSEFSNRKLKAKPIVLKRGDEARNCNHQDDTCSFLSESNNSLASQNDAEVTNTTPLEKDLKHGDPALRLGEEMPIMKLAITVPEQPSPVSVLDARFYGEDSPSPLKKISTAFTDDESLEAYEAVWHAENLDNWQKIRTPNLSIESTNNKLANIGDLIHKLKQLNPEATTDKTIAPCACSNPTHQYITRILLASGLLKDVSSMIIPIQIQQTGHLINPNLFHVLEQTDGRTELLEEVEVNEKVNKKTQRKVVFDTVNEILVRKFSADSIFLGRRNQNGQELLKEIHEEVELLQNISNCSSEDEEDHLVSTMNADMTCQSEDWTAYSSEVPSLNLDIERLIFKDLISEVISDEIARLVNPQKRHCRQLFTK